MDTQKFNKYKTASLILEKGKQRGLINALPGNNSNDIMKAMQQCLDGELHKVYKTSPKGIVLPPCVRNLPLSLAACPRVSALRSSAPLLSRSWLLRLSQFWDWVQYSCA